MVKLRLTSVILREGHPAEERSQWVWQNPARGTLMPLTDLTAKVALGGLVSMQDYPWMQTPAE